MTKRVVSVHTAVLMVGMVTTVLHHVTLNVKIGDATLMVPVLTVVYLETLVKSVNHVHLTANTHVTKRMGIVSMDVNLDCMETFVIIAVRYVAKVYVTRTLDCASMDVISAKVCVNRPANITARERIAFRKRVRMVRLSIYLTRMD